MGGGCLRVTYFLCGPGFSNDFLICLTYGSYDSMLGCVLNLDTLGNEVVSNKIMDQEMLETFREGLGRLGHQRAKLEKIQRMRQAIEKRNLAWKHFKTATSDLDHAISSVDT
jgi:hypothetical protein